MEKIRYIERRVKRRGEYRYSDSILSSNKKIKSVKEIDKLCEITNVSHTKMEILYNDEDIKPYFDYDYKQKRRYTEEELEEHLQKCKYGLNVFFGEIVNDWDISRDVAIASRHGRVTSGEYKISYRFYVINGMYTNLQTMDALVKTRGELSMFDKSVYNHNRKMGMLYGHKSKEDRRVLLPIEKMRWRQMDFVIQYVPTSYKYELMCEMPEINMITREKKVYCSELMNIEAMEMPTDIRYDIEMEDIRGLLSIIPNDKEGIIDTNTWITIGYSMCEAKKKEQTTMSYEELKRIFLEFSKRYPGSDTRRDSEVFDSCVNNTKYDIGIDYLYGLIRRIYPKYWKEYNERKIRKPKEMEYDEEYCEEEMRDYRLGENDLVLVKANPGVGKTVQLRRQIEKLSVDTRICFISYNKVLCYKYYQEFPNFKLYCEENDYDADRIVICLDSLYKIEECEFDMVILDEAFSVQSHFEALRLQSSGEMDAGSEYSETGAVDHPPAYVPLCDTASHRNGARSVDEGHHAGARVQNEFDNFFRFGHERGVRDQHHAVPTGLVYTNIRIRCFVKGAVYNLIEIVVDLRDVRRTDRIAQLGGVHDVETHDVCVGVFLDKYTPRRPVDMPVEVSRNLDVVLVRHPI